MTSLFVAGIDTDVGKTQVCGALAKSLMDKGFKVFTQKLVETGCENGISNDLLVHERIVGRPFNLGQPKEHCPYTFTLPASPHLSAELEGVEVNVQTLSEAKMSLEQQCEHLLIEGAGGLCVPLNNELMIIDFIVQHHLPIVLVSSARLGSINHTILSLELCLQRGVEVRAVVYNQYPETRQEIFSNTRSTLQNYLQQNSPETSWLELSVSSDLIELSSEDFSNLLK